MKELEINVYYYFPHSVIVLYICIVSIKYDNLVSLKVLYLQILAIYGVGLRVARYGNSVT